MLVPEFKRFLLVGVINPQTHREWALEGMGELESLVHTYGGEVMEKEIQHRVYPDRNTYIGKGKVEWLKEVVKEKEIEVVVLNDVLKAGQMFRLLKILWEVNPRIQVWDRLILILHIFEKHASTREAKLQIELARLEHEGPKIYGLGKTLLSRQGGGIGTRGLGETNIERERRVIKDQTAKIRKELKKIGKQKRRRLDNRQEKGLGPVALVGYTSAGKTSLFNVLTGKQKEAHEKLFTTLDTVVGKMKAPDLSLPILVSDTIGFIRDLPPSLIDAFRSTLMESMEAKLVLHVVDVGDDDLEDKIEVVDGILRDLQVEQPVVLVFNKLDQIDEGRMIDVHEQFDDVSHVFVSAKTGEGIGELKNIVRDILVGEMREEGERVFG